MRNNVCLDFIAYFDKYSIDGNIPCLFGVNILYDYGFDKLITFDFLRDSIQYELDVFGLLCVF